MTAKITSRKKDDRKPVALIREGQLYLGLSVHLSNQQNGYLDVKTGHVRSNGTGTIPGIADWNGAELIYPGDTISITFGEA